MSSKTRLTTFRRIADAGDLAPLLVQLMMVVNDMGIAEHGRRYWSGELPTELRDRARGRVLSFATSGRHTFEGLKVIGKIKKISAFMEKLERCDVPTQEAFSRLAAFIGTGFKLRMIAS
jgi:hypothetical protein